MDSNAKLVFITDLRTQMASLERIHQRLGDRAQGLTVQDLVRMESVAYQIHNFYNAVEDLLKLIAAHFENNIADTVRWHSALLQRMLQEIPGVRPAILSFETFTMLDQLRSFRHFFRHTYETPLDYEQLISNLKRTDQVLPLLRQDIQRLIEAI
jgi:hypothetical protein